MTPRELMYLVDRRDEEELRLDTRTGVIAMILANAFRDTKKHRAFTVLDFISPRFAAAYKEKRPKTSWKEQLSFLKSLSHTLKRKEE